MAEMSLPGLLTITPGQALRGEASLPGDKSMSHRAALLAALAEGRSQVDNFLVAGVTAAMLGALTELGVPWQLQDTRLTVEGRGLRNWSPVAAVLNCGNSATTMRLLTGALAAVGAPAVLDGSEGLRRRPMNRIVEPLRQMGVALETEAGGRAPLRLAARPAGQRLSGLSYTLPVASAQVKSCLLLAGLAADGPVTLSEPGPSRDHTERMLRGLGWQVESWLDADGLTAHTRLHPMPGRLAALQLSLPGDMSAAAFLIVAALITPGSDVILRSVGLNPTRTGLLDVLRSMGGQIAVLRAWEQHGEPVGDLHVRHSALTGQRVAGPLVVRMIDEFPAFAAAAAFAEGETVVAEADELRHKESDRIGALCGELVRLGVAARETTDGFIIQGGQAELPSGSVEVNAHGDHRLAMALALLGLAGRAPVTVHGAQMIGESFPAFAATLRQLGADVR